MFVAGSQEDIQRLEIDMAYILITGASSGIGKQFALDFAKKDFDLVLTSTNIDRLNLVKEEINNLYKVDIKTIGLDLSLVDECEKLYDYVLSENLDVECLVNNAGFGDYGDFVDGDLNKYQKMLDLNCKALMSLSFLFGNYFKEKGEGHIVNIASIAGFLPGPYMSVYYASKAFVLNFSLALKEELEKYNIKVTTICPGPIDTGFWNKANVKLSKFKKRFLARSPKQLVKGSDFAMVFGGLYVDGFINKLALFFSDFLDKETLSKVVYFVNKKLNSKGE